MGKAQGHFRANIALLSAFAEPISLTRGTNMKKNIPLFFAGLCALMSLGLSLTPAGAENLMQVSCPSLSTAEKLGDCPSDTDLKNLYRETCSPMLERQGECTPYDKFAKSKNKALWAAMSANEEFLSYIQCTLPDDTIKASKIVSIDTKCDQKTGRCVANCGYENGVKFSLRVQGSCETTTRQKIDCQTDPALCVATCEIYK